MQFAEVIGQQKIKEQLLKNLTEGRIAHAQIFSGPQGTGALAAALAYAQYLCCENKQPDDSCNLCSSCLKYKKLIHPDLHFTFPVAIVKDKKAKTAEFMDEWRKAVIENPYLSLQEWYEYIGIENKQGFISVEESSEIMRKLSLKTFESKYKVMIIWMVEKMRVDAANKLLKIIEEPPDNTVFILVTENRDQIISTIRSRTQLFKIPRISDADLQDALKQKLHVDFHEARRIIHLADGNYNYAKALAQNDPLNSAAETEFIDWMRMCFLLTGNSQSKDNFTKLNKWIDIISKAGRERQKSFIIFGLSVARECLLTNYADHSLIRITDEVVKDFSRFAPFIHFNNAGEFAAELNKACFHIERNGNPRILFLDLSFKIHKILKIKEQEN